MAKRISLYNYKEKIGKSTSAYYMAKALSDAGKSIDDRCRSTMQLNKIIFKFK